MDEAYRERVQRLKEVSEEITKLNPAIRAAAFELLADYLTGAAAKAGAIDDGDSPNGDPKAQPGAPAKTNNSEFFAAHSAKKPSDNVYVIAAYLYSMYGSVPFGLDAIREIAGARGMTIPASPDMTLRRARRQGRQMFRKIGRNQYEPTVHGELYLQK